MDVQMTLDYIGSLDSETAEQTIKRFEQAKVDSADSWILDGDCGKRTMDGLISRSVLLNDLSYCAPELWQDEEYIKAKIMKQHTVDAIPVDWIFEQMQILHELHNKNEYVLLWLMELWQKEQKG